MFRLFRRESSVFRFTADDFRIDQQEPIEFSLSSDGTSKEVVATISHLQ